MGIFIAVFALMILMGAAALLFGGGAWFMTLSKERKKKILRLITFIILGYAGLYCLLRLGIGILNRYYLDNPEAPLF